MRRVRDAVGRLHPEALVGLVQHLDVAQHLDPVGRVPAGHDQAQREAVQERQLLAVHPVSDHHLAVAGVVEVEALHKVGRVGHHGLVEPVEAHRHRACLDAGAVEHILESHADPLGIAHRPVVPLATGDAGLEQAARVARTLIDGGELDARQIQHVFEREAERPLDVAPHGEPKRGGVDALGDHGPVPAHEEAVVGGEHALVEHLERRFQQRRTRALQDHRTLLRKGAGHRTVARVARQRQAHVGTEGAARPERQRSGAEPLQHAASRGPCRDVGVRHIDPPRVLHFTLGEVSADQQSRFPFEPIVFHEQFSSERNARSRPAFVQSAAVRLRRTGDTR